MACGDSKSLLVHSEILSLLIQKLRKRESFSFSAKLIND